MIRIKLPLALIAHIVFIIIVYILQSMVFTYIRIGGILPLLLPIAVVGIATFEGAASGGGYGLLAGILCDLSFNEPVLVMTVVLTLVGIFIGILSETIMARGFPSFFISCVGALILTAFVSMFSLLFFSGADIFALVMTGVQQSLYSIVFAFPMYPVVRWLGRWVNN